MCGNFIPGVANYFSTKWELYLPLIVCRYQSKHYLQSYMLHQKGLLRWSQASLKATVFFKSKTAFTIECACVGMSCIPLTFSNFIFGLLKIFKNVADLFRFRKFCPRQDLWLASVAAAAFEILEMEKFLNVKLRNLLLIWFDFDVFDVGLSLPMDGVKWRKLYAERSNRSNGKITRSLCSMQFRFLKEM